MDHIQLDQQQIELYSQLVQQYYYLVGCTYITQPISLTKLDQFDQAEANPHDKREGVRETYTKANKSGRK